MVHHRNAVGSGPAAEHHPVNIRQKGKTTNRPTPDTLTDEQRADVDFVSVPLSPVDKDGNTRRTLYVQLKSCLTVDQKYRNFPDLLTAFPHTWTATAKSRPAPGTERIWYLVPHEILVDIVAGTVKTEKNPGMVS